MSEKSAHFWEHERYGKFMYSPEAQALFEPYRQKIAELEAHYKQALEDAKSDASTEFDRTLEAVFRAWLAQQTDPPGDQGEA